MNQPPQSAPNSGTIVTTLTRRWYLWIFPTVAAALAAVAYTQVQQPAWRASQTLLVRDEAGAETERQGRFHSVEAMQTFQETIQEVARNHSVVAATLRDLGPPPGEEQPDQWPTDRDIETVRRQIEVGAPGGAEFGRTEVIYLSVTACSPERSVELCRTLCDHLDERMRHLRNEKAVSLIAELERSFAMAQEDLELSTVKLQAFEQQVGSDLGELRILSDAGAGESNLRSSLNQLEAELREADGSLRSQQQQERLLIAARTDADRLLATPSHLLDSQPALRRLKDGLVDAQLRTAELSSMMSEQHPRVQAALTAEAGIRRELHAEIEAAVQGLTADVQVTQERVTSLNGQLDDVRRRLDRLAELRARYSNLVAEVNQRTGIVDRTRNDLTEARASQSAAQTASLMTRVDSPRAGDYPVGPSRKVIVAGGVAGGLMAGLGLVFLVAPLSLQAGAIGRRWSDRVASSWGRRQADSQPSAGRHRRSTDRAAPSVSSERRAEDRSVAGRATDGHAENSQETARRGRRDTDRFPDRSSDGTSGCHPTANPDGGRRDRERVADRHGQ